MTEQARVLACLLREERFVLVKDFDRDIHSGEIYPCGSCGIQVIFTAPTVDDDVPPPTARLDGHVYQPEPCRFGPKANDAHKCERRPATRCTVQRRVLPDPRPSGGPVR